MRLYVANGTRQVQVFAYRLPGDPRPYQMPIPVGMQAKVPQDLGQQEIDYIIEHHSKYGMVHCKDVDRARPFVGICYNIDKPVPANKIEATLEHNTSLLKQKGVENRKMAALAANQTLEKTLQQNPGLADLTGLDMTIMEETRQGQLENPDAISEEIFVSKDVERDRHNKTEIGRKARNLRRDRA